MDIMSHRIVNIKGCQHSKHVPISLFQAELFPKEQEMMYLIEI